MRYCARDRCDVSSAVTRVARRASPSIGLPDLSTSWTNVAKHGTERTFSFLQDENDGIGEARADTHMHTHTRLMITFSACCRPSFASRTKDGE